MNYSTGVNNMIVSDKEEGLGICTQSPKNQILITALVNTLVFHIGTRNNLADFLSLTLSFTFETLQSICKNNRYIVCLIEAYDIISEFM